MKSSILITHEKLRRIYFIDHEDKEIKETIKNAREKLETSVAPAVPCKIAKNCGSGGSNKIKNKTKQNLRVFWKLMNPQECVWEIRYRIITKTIFAGKGEDSLQHYNLVHKFIPVPQSYENSGSKSSGAQGMGKNGENFGVELDESAESVRNGHSLVTNQPLCFPPHPVPDGMLNNSLGCRAAKMGRQAFGTHMTYR